MFVCLGSVFLPVLRSVVVHNKRTGNQGSDHKELQLCLDIVTLFKTIKSKRSKRLKLTQTDKHKQYICVLNYFLVKCQLKLTKAGM